MTLVTIITVSFRSAKTIADTCRSIAAQTHPAIEHLIIDGGSTDGTCDVARQHCRPGTIIVSERDNGIYDAMNKGLRLARGEVVGFLNADDLYAHAHVLSRIAAVMADPTIEACFADVVYVDQDDPRHIRRWWRSGPRRASAIASGWIPAHPTVYARRSIYERFGAFDTRYRLAADHECLSRFLHRHRIRTAYVPEVWVKMRVGGATNASWHNIVQQNREILSGMSANHIPISPLLPIWKILDRIRQRWASRRLMRQIDRRTIA